MLSIFIPTSDLGFTGTTQGSIPYTAEKGFGITHGRAEED